MTRCRRCRSSFLCGSYCKSFHVPPAEPGIRGKRTGCHGRSGGVVLVLASAAYMRPVEPLSPGQSSCGHSSSNPLSPLCINLIHLLDTSGRYPSFILEQMRNFRAPVYSVAILVVMNNPLCQLIPTLLLLARGCT